MPFYQGRSKQAAIPDPIYQGKSANALTSASYKPPTG